VKFYQLIYVSVFSLLIIACGKEANSVSPSVIPGENNTEIPNVLVNTSDSLLVSFMKDSLELEWLEMIDLDQDGYASQAVLSVTWYGASNLDSLLLTYSQSGTDHKSSFNEKYSMDEKSFSVILSMSQAGEYDFGFIITNGTDTLFILDQSDVEMFKTVKLESGAEDIQGSSGSGASSDAGASSAASVVNDDIPIGRMGTQFGKGDTAVTTIITVSDGGYIKKEDQYWVGIPPLVSCVYSVTTEGSYTQNNSDFIIEPSNIFEIPGCGSFGVQTIPAPYENLEYQIKYKSSDNFYRLQMPEFGTDWHEFFSE
jgi:hypothetical protein